MSRATLWIKSAGGASSYLLPSFTFFALGSLLHFAAYQSAEPIVVAAIFYGLGAGLLRLPIVGSVFERVAFRLVFSLNWFFAGIAAIYANMLNDLNQSNLDPAHFFELASGLSDGLSVADIQAISEGPGAVVLWRAVYEFFAVLGFEKARYVGVLLNVLWVSLTAVVGIKTCKTLFADDDRRLRRFVLLYSLCGMFWLFAAIHIRDAVILLAVSTLALFWVRYLVKPNTGNLVWLVAATLLGFTAFGLLRTEFVFVPLAMLLAGLAAILLYERSTGTRKLVIYVIAFVGVAICGVLYIVFQEPLYAALQGAFEGYKEFSQDANAGDSLGNQLITNAPLPLRLLFGSAYLFVFPIPFWSGFQLDSAYHLFKSFNALFFYALTPLLALAVLRIYRQKALRTPGVMFLLFLVIGFTLAVAGTSLETRHFGAFLLPPLVLAIVPDLARKSERVAYKNLLWAFIAMIMLVHLAWAVLKL